jgi:hypothetical protein
MRMAEIPFLRIHRSLRILNRKPITWGRNCGIDSICGRRHRVESGCRSPGRWGYGEGSFTKRCAAVCRGPCIVEDGNDRERGGR